MALCSTAVHAAIVTARAPAARPVRRTATVCSAQKPNSSALAATVVLGASLLSTQPAMGVAYGDIEVLDPYAFQQVKKPAAKNFSKGGALAPVKEEAVVTELVAPPCKGGALAPVKQEAA